MLIISSLRSLPILFLRETQEPTKEPFAVLSHLSVVRPLGRDDCDLMPGNRADDQAWLFEGQSVVPQKRTKALSKVELSLSCRVDVFLGQVRQEALESGRVSL